MHSRGVVLYVPWDTRDIIMYRMQAFYSCLIAFLCLPVCLPAQQSQPQPLRLEMQLSPFRVELYDYPNIDVMIHFTNDSSHCHRLYFHPDYPSSTYVLTKEEIYKVKALLLTVQPGQLKLRYENNRSDQPTSICTLYTSQGKF